MEYGLHVKESLNHVQNGVSFYNAIFWTSFYVPVWESPAPPRPLLGLCPSQGLRDVGKTEERDAKCEAWHANEDGDVIFTFAVIGS